MTRLCRAHRLHTALASLFTRALADYAAPAAELLLTAAAAPPEVTYTQLLKTLALQLVRTRHALEALRYS